MGHHIGIGVATVGYDLRDIFPYWLVEYKWHFTKGWHLRSGFAFSSGQSGGTNYQRTAFNFGFERKHQYRNTDMFFIYGADFVVAAASDIDRSGTTAPDYYEIGSHTGIGGMVGWEWYIFDRFTFSSEIAISYGFYRTQTNWPNVPAVEEYWGVGVYRITSFTLAYNLVSKADERLDYKR